MKKTVSLICTLVLLLCSVASLSAGAVEIGAQILENGNFEEDLVGYWNPVTAGYRMEDGENHYLSLVVDGANVYQDVYDTDGNASYRISFKYKATVDYATWVYVNNMIFTDGTLDHVQNVYSTWNATYHGNGAAEMHLKKTYDAKDADGNDNTPVWKTVSCTFPSHPFGNVLRVGVRGVSGNFDNLFGIDDIKVERIEDTVVRDGSFEGVYKNTKNGNLLGWYNTTTATLSTDAVDGNYSVVRGAGETLQHNGWAPYADAKQNPITRYWACSYWVKVTDLGTNSQTSTAMVVEFYNASNQKVGATVGMAPNRIKEENVWKKVTHYFWMPDGAIGANWRIQNSSTTAAPASMLIDNVVIRPVQAPEILLTDSLCFSNNQASGQTNASRSYVTGIDVASMVPGTTVKAHLVDPESGITNLTNATMMCALYVKSAKGIKLADVAIGTNDIDVTIPSAALAEGESYELRAYLWDTQAGLMPITEATEV